MKATRRSGATNLTLRREEFNNVTDTTQTSNFGTAQLEAGIPWILERGVTYNLFLSVLPVEKGADVHIELNDVTVFDSACTSDKSSLAGKWKVSVWKP